MKNCNSKFKIDIKKRAYWYALKIIKLLDHLSKNDSACQFIGKQWLGSATSIGVNIVEEQASSSKREFIDFLHQALKSANGSKFWLGLLRDSNKVKKELANSLLTETKELANILGSSLLTLKGKR